MPSNPEKTVKNMTAKVYNLEGKATGDIALPEAVFAVALNEHLLSRSVVMHHANSRIVTAHTKTRAERRGGGIKPWKQKGTGRARHGSIRSPLWRKGGVTWGPRNDRNYTKTMSHKERQKAFAMALSVKAASDKGLVVVENFDISEPKTKVVAALLAKLPVGKKVALVMAPAAAALQKASRNLPRTITVSAAQISVPEILNVDTVIFPKEALDVFVKRVGTVTTKSRKKENA